ncbi:hypothetical protein C8Q75DRAFT_712166 [Abortiporus biennis]|nr:hypothetical protein C8Q75DRAFT_712166 [Abortiporus biennis]
MSTAGPSTATPANAPQQLHPIQAILQDIATTNDPIKLNNQLKTLSKDSRENILASLLPGGEDPLNALDPEFNTIGCLWILVARLNSNQTPYPDARIIEQFCKRFKPQHAKHASDKVTALANSIYRIAQASNNLRYALEPLYELVTRYPPTRSHLTTIHPLFLSVCVATQSFQAALPVLLHPIMEIDTSISNITYNDNLQYHYAGGIAFGALKRWKEAEEFFEICVTAPGQAPAAIQLEALKKLTLVQLILYGKALPTPKYTHSTLVRLLKSSPYGTLSRSYPLSVPTLSQLIHKDIETFNNEKNMGLVQQAIERAPRWLISKLTSTYLTLGLDDIAKEVGGITPDEVRTTILRMIELGEINAKISADGTVTFADSQVTVTKAEVDKALLQAQEQSKVLLQLERAMNLNKDYLTKVRFIFPFFLFKSVFFVVNPSPLLLF